MASQSIPPIPPRPARSQDPAAAAPTASNTLAVDMPKIPPRPARRIDRSQSPNRENYTRSPLNENPYSHANQSTSSLYSNGSASVSNSELSRRPPSVVMPSLGQEGSEYADAFSVPEDLSSSPTQTRNIANDLKLHAPKPSLPVSSAKQRVSAVTRTDSGTAATYGLGMASSDDKKDEANVISQAALGAGIERPPSSHNNEDGGIDVGQRVPMYPTAGFVQAPSPASFATPFAQGVGFHNDGTQKQGRHHARKPSAKGFEGPPGSYGLHGHGVLPHDRFEKEYYQKHPELLKKETGQYGGAIGEGRGEWAMSSEDLNKIVRETASRGSGMGE